MTEPWDGALRAVLAPARQLEPTDGEVARVLALDQARPRRRRTRRLAAACAVVALGAGTYAVPATRAAVDDVYNSISAWIGSNDDAQAPGRALRPEDDAPDWVKKAPGAKRLVAENGGAKLYVFRERGDKLSVALGSSVGITADIDGWRRQFADHAVVVLGPGFFPDGPFDADWRRPLFGLVSRSVTRVELRYATGAPSEQAGLAGGFVLLADTRRELRTLIAYDAAGRAVERLDVSAYDLRVCFDERGCPPGRLLPARQ